MTFEGDLGLGNSQTVVLAEQPLAGQTFRGRNLPPLSAFALSRSPTFKLSTTGPRPFFLLHRTSLRPLTPADELCDLTGQVVG